MTSMLWKYFSVYIGSTLKFILGPLAGASLQLTIIETWAFTVLGMMTTVLVITFAGTKIREKLQTRFGNSKASANKGKIATIWKKYGLTGVAFLTPLLFSPPIGTIVAVSCGGKKEKIIIYMLISAVSWGLIFSTIVVLGGEAIFSFIDK